MDEALDQWGVASITQATQPTPPTESVVSVPIEVPIPPVLDAIVLEEAVQGPRPSSGARPVVRVSPRNAQSQALAATKPPVGSMKAQEIDCPIVKWPAALVMKMQKTFW